MLVTFALFVMEIILLIAISVNILKMAVMYKTAVPFPSLIFLAFFHSLLEEISTKI